MADDRKLILDAMKYRSGSDSCNSFYMGSSATAGLYHILGLRYGGSEPFEDALMAASDEKVAEVKRAAQRYIDYMLEHPVSRCPTCGSIVSKEQHHG